MAEFYYRSGPNEYGPLTATELRKLAQAGRLAAADEIRRGRQGKWILAANLPGLFTLPIRREDLAINEMDVVTDLPDSIHARHDSTHESDRETAVDELASGGDRLVPRVAPADLTPDRPPAGGNSGLLVHSAPAVAAICYIAATVGLTLGIVSLFGEQSLLQRVYTGLCFLFALVGLVGGCCVSLLNSLRSRPPRL